MFQKIANVLSIISFVMVASMSGGTYFAYGRHPESGGNCGFRSDSNGASNGYLWVK